MNIAFNNFFFKFVICPLKDLAEARLIPMQKFKFWLLN